MHQEQLEEQEELISREMLEEPGGAVPPMEERGQTSVEAEAAVFRVLAVTQAQTWVELEVLPAAAVVAV